MKSSTRILEYDIIKAICIILVVAGHAQAPIPRFIGLFYVSVFFIVSGITYKTKYSLNIRTFLAYLKRKLKLLYVPYVVFNSIYILLHNLFIKCNIYSTNELNVPLNQSIVTSIYNLKQTLIQLFKTFLFQGNEQMLGGAWFPRILFYVSVLYCFIDCLIHRIKISNNCKKYIQLFISIVFLSLGYFFSINSYDLHGFARIFTCYPIYYMGVLLKELNFYEISNDKTVSYVLISTCSIILYFLSINGYYINLNGNDFSGPISLTLSSISGFILLFYISKSVLKLKFNTIFLSIGQSSLHILFLHLLIFKLFTFIEISIYDLPKTYIACYPIYYIENSFWWIIYIIFGVLISLSISKIILSFKKSTKRILTK